MKSEKLTELAKAIKIMRDNPEFGINITIRDVPIEDMINIETNPGIPMQADLGLNKWHIFTKFDNGYISVWSVEVKFEVAAKPINS